MFFLGFTQIFYAELIALVFVFIFCKISNSTFIKTNDNKLMEKFRVAFYNTMIMSTILNLGLYYEYIKYEKESSFNLNRLGIYLAHAGIVELIYYFWHMAMHRISFLRPIHKKHHQITPPMAFIDAFYLHWLDFTSFVIILLIPFFIGLQLTQTEHLVFLTFEAFLLMMEHTEKWFETHKKHHTPSKMNGFFALTGLFD